MFPCNNNKKTNSYLINNFFNKLDDILDSDDTQYFDNNNLFHEYDNNLNVDFQEEEQDFQEEENILSESDILNNYRDNNNDNDNKKYNYDILNNLDTNLSNLEDIIKSDNKNNFIRICAYNVNTESKYPFLQFLLIKDIFENELGFPYILIENNSKNIVKEVELFLNIILLDIKSENKYIMNGFKIIDEEIYIFIEINDDNIKIDNNDTFLGLIDEITNVKHIYNIKINSKITNFFIENSDFIFLKKENGASYEIPVVVYQSLEEKILNFTFMFGIRKSESTAIMGPYYYFTDYKNALVQFKDKNVKYGIIRSALFLGSMKVPMNFQDDEIDESNMKKELLEGDELIGNHEKLTMRISDHDGNWAKIYDSVYLGRTELDDGTLLQNTPLWVVKEYNQQFSLSCKTISKKIKIF